jgi:hypothetical protein
MYVLVSLLVMTTLFVYHTIAKRNQGKAIPVRSNS